MSDPTQNESTGPKAEAGFAPAMCSTADRATWLVGEWKRRASDNRERAKRLELEADQLDACAYDLECRIDKQEKKQP